MLAVSCLLLLGRCLFFSLFVCSELYVAKYCCLLFWCWLCAVCRGSFVLSWYSVFYFNVVVCLLCVA